MSTAIIEIIDKAIENAAAFQSITVNDEGTTTNQNLDALRRMRETLMQEEDRKTRVTFARIDMSDQY